MIGRSIPSFSSSAIGQLLNTPASIRRTKNGERLSYFSIGDVAPAGVMPPLPRRASHGGPQRGTARQGQMAPNGHNG